MSTLQETVSWVLLNPISLTMDIKRRIIVLIDLLNQSDRLHSSIPLVHGEDTSHKYQWFKGNRRRRPQMAFDIQWIQFVELINKCEG